MKNLLLLLTIGISWGVVNADTQITYSIKPGEANVVKDTISFPGYGKVTADKVCVTADKQTLKASIAQSTTLKCAESVMDRSDSTYPKEVCTKWTQMTIPSMQLSVPVTTRQKVCVKWSYDYSDSTRPVKTCVQEDYGSVNQSLTYRVFHYRADDYRHEGQAYSYASVKTCL